MLKTTIKRMRWAILLASQISILFCFAENERKPVELVTHRNNQELNCNLVEIEIKTDNYPEETSWELFKNDTVIMSRGPYDNVTTIYKESLCLEYDNYKLSLKDDFGDGFENESYYLKLASNGHEVFHVTGNYDYHIDYEFVFCSNNTSCDDGNLCSHNVCNLGSNICSTKEDCTYCGLMNVTVEFKTSSDANENKWEIIALHDKQVKASGGPYSDYYNWYKSNICLDFGVYSFAVIDSDGDGSFINFKIFYNGFSVLEGTRLIGKSETKLFGLCMNDLDCNDSCSSSICNLTTNLCQFKHLFEVEVKTDDPENASWEIFHNDTVVISGGPFNDERTTYKETFCLDDNLYKLRFKDMDKLSWSDFSCVKILLDDYEVFEISDDFDSFIEHEFTVCSNDTYCDDGNLCTQDTCNLHTNTCSNYINCALCDKIHAKINFDGSLGIWEITNQKDLVIVSGGPYLAKFELYMHVVCLDYGLYYFIVISDAPGSIGGYDLKIKDHTVMGLEKITSKIEKKLFGLCSNDMDCSDLCVASTCNVTTNVCEFKYLLELEVKTDYDPRETSWEIFHHDSVFLSSDYYNGTSAIYKKNFCVDEHTYKLRVIDSGGNGFSYGYSYLKLSSNDKVIFDVNGDFGSLVENDFTICTYDVACDDGNSCTLDFCDLDTNTCSYLQDCSLCDKKLVEVEFETGRSPDSNQWEITDLNNITQVSGGPYKERNQLQKHNACLSNGLYHLSVNDEDEDSSLASYKVIFNGNSAIEVTNIVGRVEKRLFGLCENDADCNNYCSSSVCNLATNFCELNYLHEIRVKTDYNAEKTSWKIVQNDTVIMSAGPFDANNAFYFEKFCLKEDFYKLQVNSANGLGFSRDAYLALSSNGQDYVHLEGNFGFKFEKTFALCSNDASCDDDESCTEEFCDMTSNVCSFYQNCALCNKMPLEVEIRTSGDKEDTLWEVTDQNMQVIASGGPYDSNYFEYKHSICIAHGMYNFSVIDKTGDGSYVDYKFMINGMSFFEDSQVIGEGITKPFGLCRTDIECNDDNKCSLDTCNVITNLCEFHTNCLYCGKREVIVDFETRYDPQHNEWEIIDQNSQVLYNGGPYKNRHQSFRSKLCLANGLYTFVTHDNGGDGSEAYYKVSLNGQKMVENDGIGGYGERKIFGLCDDDSACINDDKDCAMNKCDSDRNFCDFHLNCAQCGLKEAKVAMMTPRRSRDVSSWKITNDTNHIVLKGGPYSPYTEEDQYYHESTCLNKGLYHYSISNNGKVVKSSIQIFLDDYSLHENNNIGMGESIVFGICDVDEDCVRSNPCYKSTCSGSSSLCNFDVDCSACGLFQVDVEIQTYTYLADNIYWKILTQENEVVVSAGPLNFASKSRSVACVDYGYYFFNMYDLGWINPMASYKVKVNGTVALDRINVDFNEKKIFGICRDDSDCIFEDDSCVATYCDKSLNICRTQQSCSNCGLIELEVAFHNFDDGDEYSWKLLDSMNKTILSGGPFIGKYMSNVTCVDYGYYYFMVFEEQSNNFLDGTKYKIRANGSVILQNDGSVSHAEMKTIILCSNDSDCLHTNDPCVPSICSASTSACVMELDCSLCGKHQVDIEFNTFRYPSGNSWKLSTSENQILLQENAYHVDNNIYYSKICLNYGSYYFEASDNKREGTIGAYKVFVNGLLLIDGKEIVNGEKKLVGICQDDSDCFDQDPCTFTTCDKERGICDTKLICSPCDLKQIQIDFLIKNSRDETYWNLLNAGGELLATGGPYLEEGFKNQRLLCYAYGLYTLAIYNHVDDMMKGATYRVYVENIVAAENILYIGYQETANVGICSNDETCDDGNVCTKDYCDSTTNICRYELECRNCDLYEAEVVFNADPDEDYEWWLVNMENEVLLSGGPYKDRGLHYSNKTCVERDLYKFTMQSIYDFTQFASYSVKINGVIVAKSDEKVARMETNLFGICVEDNDCNDGDSCTRDFCNSITNICTFELNCNECDLIHLQIETRTNNKQRSTWKLVDSESQVILEGGPYYEAYKLFKKQICIAKDSSYNLITYNEKENDGISSYYNVLIDGVLLTKIDGDFSLIRNEYIKYCQDDIDCIFEGLQSCTFSYCDIEMKQCRTKLKCDLCGLYQAALSVTTEANNKHLSWEAKEIITNKTVARDGPFYGVSTHHEKQVCLSLGSYVFSISSVYGDDGVTDYEISVNDVKVAQKLASDIHYEETNIFGICLADSDCLSLHSCTSSYCNTTSNYCYYEKLPCNECDTSYSNCAKLDYCIPTDCRECGLHNTLIGIKTNDLPHLTAWNILDLKGNITVATGGSYPECEDVECNVLYEHSLCLGNGIYNITINHHMPSGLSYTFNAVKQKFMETKWFMLVNGNTVFAKDGFFRYESSKFFGLCTSDEFCDDGDECTLDVCDVQQNICRYEKLPCSSCLSDYKPCIQFPSNCFSSCSECNKKKIHITLRKDEDRFNWKILNLYSNELIMSMPYGIFRPFVDGFVSACVEDDSYRFVIGTNVFDGGYLSLEYDDKLIREIKGPMSSPDNFVTIICSYDSDCEDDDVCTVEKCDLETRKCVYERMYSFDCRSFGNPSILAILVNAEDINSTISRDELTNNLFGIPAKDFSLSSQLSSCSFNKFSPIPFQGITNTGKRIQEGVFHLQIVRNIVGEQAALITDEVLSSANSELGNLQTQFDFVLLCLPPSLRIGVSSNWKAYAYINSYLSIYNDENCLFPTILIHELGHNLGLSHSNDHKNYGDTTGNMGVSYRQLAGPKKCFNGPKSWALGWYDDSHEILNLAEIGRDEYVFYLVGVANYDGRHDRSTILKLMNAGDSFDYYISFNAKSTLNTGTDEGVNQVHVVKQNSGSVYDDSSLVGILGDHGGMRIKLSNEENLEINVGIHLDESPPYARVEMEKSHGSECRIDSNCDDNNRCTKDTCWDFVCEYEPISCSECGALVTIKVKTSSEPDKLFWTLSQYKSGNVAKTSLIFQSPYQFYNESSCYQSETYIFSIWYTGETCPENSPIEYYVYVGSELIDNYTITEEIYLESLFIICTGDLDCLDYDGCSIDFCNPLTNMCDNIPAENDGDCVDCVFFTIDIVTDNFPEETSWGLYNKESDDIVIAGAPYNFDLNGAFGRSKAPTKAGRSKAPTKAGRSKAPTRASSRLSSTPLSSSASLETLDNDEENHINEKTCLETKYPYYFFIADSFGDGICCSEGEGRFSISSNTNVIAEGGNFDDLFQLTFLLQDCTSSLDCSDGDFCTFDKCDPLLSMCFFEKKPCLECGAFVTVGIMTDFDPVDTTWVIKKDSKELFAGGPYTLSFHTYESSHCLAIGWYNFTVSDKQGDGTECDIFDTECGYTISINNYQVTKVTYDEREYWSEKKSIIHICMKDSDCVDSNFCLVGSCANNVCHSFDAPQCDSCNRVLVTIQLITDSSPEIHQWSVHDVEMDEVVAFFDSYKLEHTFHKHSYCFTPGLYEFEIQSTSNGGLCDGNSDCGSYAIHVDSEVIKHGANFRYSETSLFRIILKEQSVLPSSFNPSYFESINPSVSPSLLHSIPLDQATFQPSYDETLDPSIPPTALTLSSQVSHNPSYFETVDPSASPSFLKSIHSTHVTFHPSFHESLEPSNSPSTLQSKSPLLRSSWSIKFLNYSVVDDFLNSSKPITLEYLISKERVADELSVQLLDKTCLPMKEHNPLYMSAKHIIEEESAEFNKGIIILSLNSSGVEKNAIWKVDNEEQAYLDACIKTELSYHDVSIAFLETKIHLKMDLIASSLSINDVTLEKDDITAVVKDYKGKVSACVCNPSSDRQSFDCLENVSFRPNSKLKICISSVDAMLVNEFESVTFFQDEIIKFIAVKDGVPNKLVSITRGYVGVFETRLISAFFLPKNKPSPLLIEGTVLLGLNKDFRRLEGNRKEVSAYIVRNAHFLIDVHLRQSKSYSYLFAIAISVIILVILAIIKILSKFKNKHRYILLHDEDIDLYRG